MKKFYTVFLLALVGMVCSFGAGAQDELPKVKLTLNVDRDNAVEYKVGYSGDWHPLTQGDNEVEITGYYAWGSYQFDSVYFGPLSGFKLEAISCPDDANAYIRNPMGENSFYVYESSQGRVYTITTTDLSEVRTSTLNLNITGDATLINVARNGLREEVLEAGAQAFKFDPATELPLTFTAKNVPCYVFELDGVPVDFNASREYTVSPTDGQSLEIATVWPADLKANITVNIPEEMKDAVKLQVYPDNGWTPSDVEGFVHNQANSVGAGHYYYLKFDDDAYEITGLTINGNASDNLSSQRVFVGKDDVVVNVEAKVKERFHIIIRMNETGSASVATDAYGYDYQPLKPGENIIYPAASYWGGYNSVYVKAGHNHKITKFECAEAEHYPTLPSSNDNAVSISPSESWNGRVYDLETVCLDDLRPHSLTVNVVGSTDYITFRRADNSAIALTTGENTIRFADEELPLRVSRSVGSGPIYRVVLNGTPVAYDTNSYVHTFDVADGDNLEIEAAWPDKTVGVTINIPEEAKAALNKIQYGSYPYTDITEWEIGKPIEIPAGNMLSLGFNTQDYKLQSIKIGDELITSISSMYTFFVGEDPVEVTVDARTYGALSFALTVDEAERVSVHPGYLSEPAYELVSGERKEFTVDERTPTIYIKVPREYVISSIVDVATEQPVELSSSGSFEVKDGMDIVISTAEKEFDARWAMWIEDINDMDDTWDGNNKECYYYYDSQNNYFSESGYTIVNFASADTQTFRINGYLDGYNAILYPYLNNEILPPGWTGSYSGSYNYQNFKPQDGDVLRYYTKGVQPSLHAISFDVAGDYQGISNNITVVTDKVKTRADWKEGFEILTGAHIALTLPEGADGVKVSLDDAELEPDADGVYSFVASADHKVTVSSTSLIETVEAGDADSLGTVYNLQGIKVLDNASAAQLKQLPAGIYIVNGEKKVVR